MFDYCPYQLSMLCHLLSSPHWFRELIAITNGSAATTAKANAPALTHTTFAYSAILIISVVGGTGTCVDFQAKCAALCLSASDSTFNFFHGCWKNIRNFPFLRHESLQKTFPVLDHGAVISYRVVDHSLCCFLAVFVGFTCDFDSFLESISFQVNLLQIVEYFLVNDRRFSCKNSNHVAFFAIN